VGKIISEMIIKLYHNPPKEEEAKQYLISVIKRS
jgi:hypothetical protein